VLSIQPSRYKNRLANCVQGSRRGKGNSLKKSLILGCLAAMVAVAQEKPTGIFASIAPQSYSPAQVRVLGDVEYGQSKTAARYAAGPRYRAFVFSGYGGDKVEITLKGPAAKMPIVLADSTLNQIAAGTSQLSVSLPNRGPDIEVWYVLTDNTPAQFTVQVKKIGHVNSAIEAKL
jgi:hypothetical protein